ncbi:SusC/RagA family TonB-linked outer membrane protein [Capnocytophaga canis]|uniref:SusC/RagA family TonB-linked outer membrane protein n=1 Tax=Capnocytophaga canis TaxID=1848903 RepID=UPI00156245D4|nr:SusC/RagA family TonB-linked outer membrane protein [Capnocytophaga canis]
MRGKLISTLSLFFFALQFVFAQEKTITGMVKDESGQPLLGVTVTIKGTTRGVATDFDGNYSIKAKAGEVLHFVALGMKPIDRPVSASTTKIDVIMEEEAHELEEVVVVAYGTAKKQSLVGSQAMVSAKQLETRPITNLTTALSGIAPGVQSTLSSGQPGSSSSIRIRGFGSINAGSDPIYVLDGSIYNGRISDIVMQDVESISVLKDAASTSLYGSSAGNGVVLITTKSGSRGKKGKPSFTYSNNIGFSTRGQEDYEKVGAMDHLPLRFQQWFNHYKYNRKLTDEQAAAWANYDMIQQYTPEYIPYAGINSYYQFAGGKWNYHETKPSGRFVYPAVMMMDGTLNPSITGLLWAEDLDWEKALFRTGVRNEHSINVSHNTENLKSYFSLNYLKEDGYQVASDYERFAGRANLSYDVNKWLTVGTNIGYSTMVNHSPTLTGNQTANTFRYIRNIAPIYPIHKHNPDGSYVYDDKGNKVYDYSQSRLFAGNYNPIYLTEVDLLTTDNNSANTRSFAELRFLPELKLKLSYAHDVLRYTTKRRYNNIFGDQPEGLLRISHYKNATTTFNQVFDYNKTFGKHNINALLGHESYKYQVIESETSKKGMAFLGIDEMGNFIELSSASSSTDEYTKEGYFGRFNYGFDSKYDFSFSFRRDGSSRFHKNHRWGNFWSVGAGWHLKKEAFLANVSWIDQLKLRASYGTTGNDATSGFYPYQTAYSFSNNNTNAGLRIATYGYPNLLWEKQVSTDIALEFDILKRLKGTVELFNKESDDLIFAFPLPTSTGIGSINKNIGKVQNRGIEIELTVDLVEKPDFKWSFTANGTILKNKVLRLPDHSRKLGQANGNYRYMEGYSVYDYYLPQWAGVNPDTGHAMYVIDAEQYPSYADVNHAQFKGVDKDKYSAYTYDYNVAKHDFSGSAIPDLQGGFGTNVNWKGFEFGVQFTYMLGGKAYDAPYQGLMSRDKNAGTAAHVDLWNAWKKPGDITDVPRLDDSTAGEHASKSSNRFLISRTSLMLRNLSVGYSLPKEVLTPYGITNLRIGISAENLFLWSKRKGMNPMNSFSGTASNIGYDYAKVVSCGLSVSF